MSDATQVARLAPRHLRSIAAVLAVGAVVVAIVVVLLPLTPSYDLDVFLRAGYAAVHGQQVYPSPGSAAVYSGSSFVYPYFAVWPFAALAGVSPGLSTMLFYLLCVCALLAACLVGANRDAWPAILTLCSAFAITGLQLGALSPLLFVGAVFLWRQRERPVAFALLAAPVIACKLFLAPLLLWPLLARRYRAFAYASAASAALLALSFALGPIGPAPYLQLLSQLGAHEASSGFGLVGALINARVSPIAAEAIAVAAAIVVCVAAYVHFNRTRDERVSFCTGIVVSLLLTPVLWSHYLILLFAMLVVLGARRRWFVALVVISWVISPPHGVSLERGVIAHLSASEQWATVGVAVALAGAAAKFRHARVTNRRLATRSAASPP
jgi:alpha-1,2-mannosyltransferase